MAGIATLGKSKGKLEKRIEREVLDSRLGRDDIVRPVRTAADAQKDGVEDVRKVLLTDPIVRLQKRTPDVVMLARSFACVRQQISRHIRTGNMDSLDAPDRLHVAFSDARRGPLREFGGAELARGGVARVGVDALVEADCRMRSERHALQSDESADRAVAERVSTLPRRSVPVVECVAEHDAVVGPDKADIGRIAGLESQASALGGRRMRRVREVRCRHVVLTVRVAERIA